MQPRGLIRAVAWSFLLHPLLVLAFIAAIAVTPDDAHTPYAVFATFFLAMLIVGLSTIGWFLVQADARANRHLTDGERSRWERELRSNPYATVSYWRRVVRKRPR